ncbi:MAG: cytochrome c3 family protein, partial [Nannocystaceae bacterium]
MSHLRGLIVLFFVATFVGGGLVGAAEDAGARGSGARVGAGPWYHHSAVYPRQEIPLRFNHARHLERGIHCERCHPSASSSRRVQDLLLPRGEACDPCHTPAHAAVSRDRRSATMVGGVAAEGKGECDKCHVGVIDNVRTVRSIVPTARLIFSHKIHAQRGVKCSTCHAGMDKVRMATTLQLPREQTCLECHDGVQAASRCSTCHPTERGGKLATHNRADVWLPRLVPQGASAWGANHDLTFVQDHAGVAKANPGLCATCHDDDSCRACHDGDVRPLRIHHGDYLRTHALDARARTQDCQACHRMQTDCRACHERLKVVPGERGSFGVGSPLRFHPEAWAGPPGQPQSHAPAARRNLATCASCHDEDACLSCHATGAGPIHGLDVNPHGSRFATGARCRSLARRNRRVCLRCHAPGDPRNDCAEA